MAYDPVLAERLRGLLASRTAANELAMMGGLCFMVNDKMCVGVYRDGLMVRIDPARRASLLARPGCSPMDFTGRVMNGFVVVDPAFLVNDDDLGFWIDEGLSFNSRAQPSKKKKPRP